MSEPLIDSAESRGRGESAAEARCGPGRRRAPSVPRAGRARGRGQDGGGCGVAVRRRHGGDGAARDAGPRAALRLAPIPHRWVPAPGLAALRPRGALPARLARLHRRPRVPGQLRPARQRRAPVRDLGGLRLLLGVGVGPPRPLGVPSRGGLAQGRICAFGAPCLQEPWRCFLCQARSWQLPLECSGTGLEHVDQPGVLLRSSVGTCCPHPSPSPTPIPVPDVSFPFGASVVCPAARIPGSLPGGRITQQR